jgi:hypothetical protein
VLADFTNTEAGAAPGPVSRPVNACNAVSRNKARKRSYS